MKIHLSVEDIDSFLEGNVTDKEREKIKLHLEECRFCREKFGILLDMENYLREEDYIDDAFTERVMYKLKENKYADKGSKSVMRGKGILKPVFSGVLICIFIGAAFYFGTKYNSLFNNRHNAATEPEVQPTVRATQAPVEIDPAPEEIKPVKVTLYFPDSNAEYVVPEYRTLRIKDHENIEEVVFRYLMEGPKEPGKESVIPEGTKLLSAEVRDGICYLNLSKEFVENNPGGSAYEIVLINSIVNSLTELPYIEKVQFLIEGEKRDVYNHLVFSEPFERNESIIRIPETSEETEEKIRELGVKVLEAFKSKDMQSLSGYVHPDKGVRFSPYTYVETEKDVVISKEELSTLPDGDKVFNWGFYDGSGEPIELTFEEYMSRFIYDYDFLNADEVLYDTKTDRGNTINNVFEVYPGSHVLEYHYKGTAEYDGMDWRSLKLVFEEKDGTWYLVGVVHDEWTI